MGQKGDRQQGHSERKPDASSRKPSDGGSKQKKQYTMREARAFWALEQAQQSGAVADDPASSGPSGDAVYQAPSYLGLNCGYASVVTDHIPGFGDA